MHKPLFLVYHGRYPSEKAASLFAAKSAEAFADVGAEVTLIVPRRLGRVRSNSYEFFHVRNNFKTVFLPTFDLYLVPIIGRFAHQISYIAFAFSLMAYLVLTRQRDAWVCSNESFPLLVATYFTSRTLYEVHDYPERSLWMYRRLFSRVRLVLTTNEWKAKALQEKFGVPQEKIIIEPNAVDLTRYENTPSRNEARQRLLLPIDKQIAVYTGHLYSWKGVDTLAGAAKLMPEVEVYIVGGTDYDLEQYRSRFREPNLHFIGHRPHEEMPLWQRAADVLVLPNTAKEEISAQYTSPMKLFEYMASGTSIVASDVPSIREISGEDKVHLVMADSAQSLAKGIGESMEYPDEERSQKARQWIEEHTWRKRAGRISSRFA